MARKVKVDSDVLVGLIDQFYAEKCDGDSKQLKIPQIGEYVRSKGYDVADYLIRRNKDAKEYIKRLQESTEESHIHTVVVYRDLDMESFLQKNNTKDKLKKALKERENYYRTVTHSASYSFKENTRLEQQVIEYKKRIKVLEEALEISERKASDVFSDNKNYKSENQKLREIINTYVYPEIANELLKQQGVLKNSAEIVNPDVIKDDIVSVDTDITGIKSKIIKGLFEQI